MPGEVSSDTRFSQRVVNTKDIEEFKHFRIRRYGKVHEFGLMRLKDGSTYLIQKKALSSFIHRIGLRISKLRRMDYRERNKVIMERLSTVDKDIVIYYDENGNVPVVASPRFSPVRHTEVLTAVRSVLGDPASVDYSKGMFATWVIKEDPEHVYSLYVYNRNDARHSLKVGVVTKIKRCGNLVFAKSKHVRIYHVGDLQSKLVPVVTDVVSYVEEMKELIERSKRTYVNTAEVLDLVFKNLAYTYVQVIKQQLSRYEKVSVYDAVYTITSTQRLTNSMAVKMKIGELAHTLFSIYCSGHD